MDAISCKWSTNVINKKEKLSVSHLNNLRNTINSKNKSFRFTEGFFAALTSSFRWIKSSGFPLWSFEWKCLYHLFCGWFNEHMTLSHERIFASSKAFPVNLYFVSYAILHEAMSKAISLPSSIQMIINHVIITFTWVHLWNRGRMKYFCQVGE